jgi:GntR family transcriptional regulator
MLIVVDPRSGVPVYRQLMDQIRFHISSGMLRPGEELPSTRVLSQQLGVNPMTISKAYGYLERDGVIERRPGRPLIVSEVGRRESGQRRVRQLRESLAPSVTAARQLGIGAREAARIFEGMLSEEGGAAHVIEEESSKEERS